MVKVDEKARPTKIGSANVTEARSPFMIFANLEVVPPIPYGQGQAAVIPLSRRILRAGPPSLSSNSEAMINATHTYERDEKAAAVWEGLENLEHVRRSLRTLTIIW